MSAIKQIAAVVRINVAAMTARAGDSAVVVIGMAVLVAAALSMTRNEFVLYSSNIFAILGLRALYLLMSHTVARLRYLHYGLSAVLAFAAFKIIADAWIHIPALLSVGVIAAIITVAAWFSLNASRRERHATGPSDGDAGAPPAPEDPPRERGGRRRGLPGLPEGTGTPRG